MRTTTRAGVAFLVSLAALIAVAIAGSQLATADSQEHSSPNAGPDDVGGGGMAMCVEGVPDCDDMVVAPDGDPCGEHVIGTGPDASVGYTPCPGDDLPGGTDDGAQLVVPAPGMSDVRPHPFDHVTLNDDGRAVTVFFWSGVEPCSVLDHVDVAYGDRAIAIALYEGHDASAGDVACIEIAVLKRVVVRLDEPVGDRQILDGAA